jgi:HD superfamily phosphodiesterase
MDVLHFAHEIYEYESIKNTHLLNQQKIIYIAAVLHDICDKKYIKEEEGIKEINDFLSDKIDSNDIKIVNDIITTMSYSKVKLNGYPDLGDYQLAYHIVREADLLAAYDFDRCMIYHLNKSNGNLEDAYLNASLLFENRVFKHLDDKLFVTNYSKRKCCQLEYKAKIKMSNWKRLLYKSRL